MIPDINLLPPIKKKSKSPTLLLGIVGIVTLLLLALVVWTYFDARSNSIRLQAEQQSLELQRDQLQMELDVLTSANRSTLEESVAFVERVSYQVSPLIDETKNLLQEHTYLRTYSFSDKTVQITVDFETISAISAYVDLLQNSPYFTDVQVGNVSNFSVAPAELETDDNRFDEVPRYSVNLTVGIDMLYIALGGVE